MMLRRRVRPLRPDFDKFLFATVGEIDGVRLRVGSALVRLGLDPWEEAGRLSSLSGREATEQLARLIAELPGNSRPLAEAREIAHPLVVLLPTHETGSTLAPQIQIRPRYLRPGTSLPSAYWIMCGVLTAAAVFSAIAYHGVQFGMGSP
jgi:hypothetical protein